MRYWPLSEVTRHLNHDQVRDLLCCFHHVRLPETTLMACNRVAEHIAVPDTPMVLIETVGASACRQYLDYPEFEHWFRLERAGFIATHDLFGLVIDTLH